MVEFLPNECKKCNHFCAPNTTESKCLCTKCDLYNDCCPDVIRNNYQININAECTIMNGMEYFYYMINKCDPSFNQH